MPTSRTTTRDYYRDFQKRVASRILLNGGSEADVWKYWDQLDQRPEARRQALAANEQALQTSMSDVQERLVPTWMGVPMHFVQGVTFGFGDEAFGTLAGLLSPELSTQQGRDYYRASLEDYQRSHKGSAMAAQIAGAIATGMAAPGAVLGAGGSGLANAGVGAAVGAGSAGLMAAGETRGGVGTRIEAATNPATLATGAAFGAAAGPVVRGAGRLAAAVSRPAIRGAKRLGGTVGEGLEGLMQRLPGSPARQARAALREAMEGDGITPSQAVAAVRLRLSQGNLSTVGDIGGSRVGALLTNAQRTGGPAQQAFSQAVRSRLIEADPRRLAELTRRLRLGSDNVYDVIEQGIASRKSLADPLYDLAYQQTVQVPPRIKKLLGLPEFRDAYEVGRQLSLREDIVGSRAGLPIPDLGDDVPDALPVRAIDYIKKGINALSERLGADGKPVMSRQESRTMGQALREVLRDVDPQVPIYGQAREIWHGFSEALETINDGYGGTLTPKGLVSRGGQGFLQSTPEEIARDIGQLDPTRRSYYRMGAMQALADAIRGPGAESVGSSTALTARSLFEDRVMMGRIRALFPDQATATRFSDYIAGELTATRWARASRPPVPAPARAATQLAPQGRVGTAVSRLTGGRHDTERVQMLADEIVALYLKGVDDPNELIAMLESLRHIAPTPLGRTALTHSGLAGARVAAGQQTPQPARRPD